MTEKLVKELAGGERVALDEGGVAEIVSCKRFPLVDAAGGAFEITYLDDDGAVGTMIVSGLSAVDVITQ